MASRDMKEKISGTTHTLADMCPANSKCAATHIKHNYGDSSAAFILLLLLLLSAAGEKPQSEAGTTAGTPLCDSGGRKEGQRMRGAISINTSADKDPSGSTERRVGVGVGVAGQLLASMHGH